MQQRIFLFFLIVIPFGLTRYFVACHDPTSIEVFAVSMVAGLIAFYLASSEKIKSTNVCLLRFCTPLTIGAALAAVSGAAFDESMMFTIVSLGIASALVLYAMRHAPYQR